MEGKKFKAGDLVIAKIKGHRAWPAIIESVEPKGKALVYNVFFYGTKDNGVCRLS
jgi:hypothetical protein